MEFAAHGRAADVDAGALGKRSAEVRQDGIRSLAHEFTDGHLRRFRYESGRTASVRRRLHGARLPGQAQDAVNGRPPDCKAVGELFVREALLRTGLNDPDPEVEGEWSRHGSDVSMRVRRASNLSRPVSPLDPASADHYVRNPL